MVASPDVWYVLLPDGHVFRAASTAAVRHHVESGRIPADSRVRRSLTDAWTLLEHTPAFADLAPGRGRAAAPRRPPAARVSNHDASRTANQDNGLHLKTVGVRGCVDELLAALDAALARGRLPGAAAVGLLGAAAFFLARHFRFRAEVWGPLPWVAAGLVLLALGALYGVVVAQMLLVELSQFRPARRAEITARLGRNWLWLFLAELLVGGLFALLIGGLAWLGGQLQEAAAGVALVGVVASVRLALEVLVWPVLGLALLLAPIVVFEERASLRALAQWWALLRRNLSRAFVYEALAVGLGVVTSLPLVLPAAFAAWACPAAELANPVVGGALAALFGLALTPLVAYLAVANVYIFLNLRYER
jgi:hypothetical protein